MIGRQLCKTIQLTFTQNKSRIILAFYFIFTLSQWRLMILVALSFLCTGRAATRWLPSRPANIKLISTKKCDNHFLNVVGKVSLADYIMALRVANTPVVSKLIIIVDYKLQNCNANMSLKCCQVCIILFITETFQLHPYLN